MHALQIAARVDASIIEAATPKKRKRRGKDDDPPSPPVSSSTPVKEEEGTSTPTKPAKEKKKKPTINDKVYRMVQDTFKTAFPGGYAGWAHSVLFALELPSAGELGSSPKKMPAKKGKCVTAEPTS